MSNAFFRDNKDFLFAIWVFKQLGWSNRRIAKLLRTSEGSIRLMISRAYAYGSTFRLRSFAKGEGGVRIRYVRDDNKLEYLNAYLHENICGGGRRRKPVHYNKNYENLGGK